MSNEAAERLLEPRPRDIIVVDLMGAGYEEDPAEMLVEQALAAERKATVDELRRRASKIYPDSVVAAIFDGVLDTLDAEASR